MYHAERNTPAQAAIAGPDDRAGPFAENRAPRISISPTKLHSPGRPTPARAATKKKKVNRGNRANSPPKRFASSVP